MGFANILIIFSGKMPIKECDVMYMFEYAFDILTKDSSSNLESNISQLLLFTSPGIPFVYNCI